MDEQPDPQTPLAVSHHSRNPAFTDREMWVAIRGYILSMAEAIKIHAKESPLAMATRAGLLGIAKAIELRWNLKNHKAN